MTKRIVLCADDYGQAPAISEGILNLIKEGRLSATSCMVNMPDWEEQAAKLSPYHEKADIGLHFNLTFGNAVSSPYVNIYGKTLWPLNVVLRKAFLRRLRLSIIEAEFQAQIDRFFDVFGRAPRFVDGHQHIHQFPVIREALLKVYEKRLRIHHTYIRLINQTIRFRDFKKFTIRLTGAQALARSVRELNIPHNSSFSGVYSFYKSYDYANLFPLFLREIRSSGLIMCHPGLTNNDSNDPIAKARYQEYLYLMSNHFLKACESQKVVLTRFG